MHRFDSLLILMLKLPVVPKPLLEDDVSSVRSVWSIFFNVLFPANTPFLVVCRTTILKIKNYMTLPYDINIFEMSPY